MKKIMFDNGDGEPILLSENSSHVRGVLRWLASRGDERLEALCAPLAEECVREERMQLREARRVETVAKAREGERQWGEPIVLLSPGSYLERFDFRAGEEMSLADLDLALKSRVKGAGAQMALQRAAKEGSWAILLRHRVRFSELNLAVSSQSNPQLAEKMKDEERIGLAQEVKFCRLSDFSLWFETFPEAHERWHRNKENERISKLPQAEQDRIRAEEEAEFRAENAAKAASPEETAPAPEAGEDNEEADFAAIRARLAAKGKLTKENI